MNAPTLRIGDLVAITLDRRTCNSLHEQILEQRQKIPETDDAHDVLLELEYAFLLCANAQAPDTFPRLPADESAL